MIFLWVSTLGINTNVLHLHKKVHKNLKFLNAVFEISV
jgi:hypothetical protein